MPTPLIFVCPCATPAMFRSSFVFGFVFQYDAYRRSSFLRISSEEALLVRKVTQWFPRHSPTGRSPLLYPMNSSDGWAPVLCSTHYASHSYETEPRMFQTNSFHQTSEAATYVTFPSFHVYLSSHVDLRLQTKNPFRQMKSLQFSSSYSSPISSSLFANYVANFVPLNDFAKNLDLDNDDSSFF